LRLKCEHRVVALSVCMSLCSVAVVFVTYVERRKVCAVAVELRIVELDELLCERGSVAFRIEEGLAVGGRA
jgi:hypothetical protein